MGNTCGGDEEVAFKKVWMEMQPCRNSQLDQNLKNYPEDAPDKKYAKIQYEKPKLSTEIQEMIEKARHQKLDNDRENNQNFNEEEQRHKESQESQLKNDQGVKLPCYYIFSLKSYYLGRWKEGKPNGKGKLFSEDGSYYQGTFQSGRPNGSDCFLVYPNLSYKKGEVKGGIMEGFGVFYYKPSNFKYKGEWKNDKPDGKGIQWFQDGSTYEGTFVNGLKDDNKGVYTWKNGKVYQGPFVKGFIEGYGELYMKEGKGRYEGQFKRNYKVLDEKKLQTDVGIYRGEFNEKGQMNGEGVFEWSDKKVYKGGFLKNKLHGEGEIIYPNHQKVKGIWQNGENVELHDVNDS